MLFRHYYYSLYVAVAAAEFRKYCRNHQIAISIMATNGWIIIVFKSFGRELEVPQLLFSSFVSRQWTIFSNISKKNLMPFLILSLNSQKIWFIDIVNKCSIFPRGWKSFSQYISLDFGGFHCFCSLFFFQRAIPFKPKLKDYEIYEKIFKLCFYS